MRCLDLCCAGGGASLGYEQAGFEVTGIDVTPQPKYRGKFIQADAVEYLREHGHEYDFVHASPPCQKWSYAATEQRKKGKIYPDLIEPIRAELLRQGKPYVMENVKGAPLIEPLVLCGAMFGLRTYRHRYFESNIPVLVPPHPEHIARNAPMGRPAKDGEFIQYVGNFPGVQQVREMTGLLWLGQRELAQSIPPQYTKFIGEQVMNYLKQINKAS